MASQAFAKKAFDVGKNLAKSAFNGIKNAFKKKEKEEKPPGEDAGIQSFGEVEKDIESRETGTESAALVADNEAQKARDMCNACSMSIKFSFTLSLMDIMMGFGISGFGISLALSLGNLPTMAGCASGCLKSVFNTFSWFSNKNKLKKATELYFGADCNPHSLGVSLGHLVAHLPYYVNPCPPCDAPPPLLVSCTPCIHACALVRCNKLVLDLNAFYSLDSIIPHAPRQMCMMLGRVQQCSPEWSKLPYIQDPATGSFIAHPLQIVSTTKPYISVGVKAKVFANDAKEMGKKALDFLNPFSFKGTSARLLSRRDGGMRAKKAGDDDKKKEGDACTHQMIGSACGPGLTCSKTSKKCEKEGANSNKKEGDACTHQMIGSECGLGLECKKIQNRIPESSTCEKNAMGKLMANEPKDHGKMSPSEIHHSIFGGQLCSVLETDEPFTVKNSGTGPTRTRECIPADSCKDKDHSCSKFNLADGCRFTLKAMSQAADKTGCAIKDLPINNLFSRCSDILGCISPFRPQPAQDVPYKLTPAKIQTTVEKFMSRVSSDHTMSSERAMSPSEATRELVKELSVDSKKSDASDDQYFESGMSCQKGWLKKPWTVFRTKQWAQFMDPVSKVKTNQCQPSWNWGIGGPGGGGQAVHLSKELLDMTAFARPTLEKFRKSSTGQGRDLPFSRGLFLADLLGATTGDTPRVCVCKCCRHKEVGDGEQIKKCSPVVAGIIRIQGASDFKSAFRTQKCNADACSAMYPTLCPSDERECTTTFPPPALKACGCLCLCLHVSVYVSYAGQMCPRSQEPAGMCVPI